MFFPNDKRVAKRDVNFSPKTVDTMEPQIRSY
jgi:succinate dehydrogenase / fumarate reductase flavoprotein subunit